MKESQSEGRERERERERENKKRSSINSLEPSFSFLQTASSTTQFPRSVVIIAAIAPFSRAQDCTAPCKKFLFTFEGFRRETAHKGVHFS